MTSPIDQFIVKTIGSNIYIGNIDISFTNSAFMMIATLLLIFIFFYFTISKVSIIPNKGQGFAEISFDFIENMVKENIGPKAYNFIPLIYSIFLFILVGNLISLIPYSFSFTSQAVVTLFMASFMLLVATCYGIYSHGVGFVKIFLPEGIPFYIAPLMIVIEIISYFAKALSMGIRLFANMTAGHIIIEIFAGFVIALGMFGFVPLAFTVLLYGFKFVISCLQAYVFSILTCIFLRQVKELH